MSPPIFAAGHPVPAPGLSLGVERDPLAVIALVVHSLSRVPTPPRLVAVPPGPRGAGGSERASMPRAPEEPPGGLDPSSIAAAAAGDRRAVEAVVDALWPRVRHLTRFLVRGDADAEDAAQEGMLAVLRGLGSWRVEGELRSWADRVVVRATFAYLERTRRDRRRLPGLVREEEELVRGRTVGGPARASLPMGELYGARRDLVRLLDQLPEAQREAVVLHHVVGMSLPEIAAREGVPVDTLKSRVKAGLRALRAGLAPTAEGWR